MLQFDVSTDSSAALYADLYNAVDGVTAGERDPIANMANVAALLWEFLPDLNWAGFYRVVGNELVLGPFQGKAACIRIPFGKGVCGTAAATQTSQCVPDVHAFPGHIACDALSRSELVVPITSKGQILAVIDLDSPTPGRFTPDDVAGCERLALLLSERICPETGQF
jgi:L-methionine (R)-S-oxide reductase